MAETTGAIMSRDEVLELVRSQLAEILEIDVSDDQRVLLVRRRPQRRLAGADRARRGARGGAQRTGGGLPHRGRGPRGPAHRARRRRLRDREGRGGLTSPSRRAAGPRPGSCSASARPSIRVEDDLLRQALSHRSYCSESGGLPSNERLEFLGDAVLGLVVTEHLYRAFPSLPEGDLARLRPRSSAPRRWRRSRAQLGVGEAVLLGKGEEASGGRTKESILADCLEAIIGAVYLSAGLEAATRLVVDRLAGQIAGLAAEGRLGDPKNQLQELAARSASTCRPTRCATGARTTPRSSSPR